MSATDSKCEITTTRPFAQKAAFSARANRPHSINARTAIGAPEEKSTTPQTEQPPAEPQPTTDLAIPPETPLATDPQQTTSTPEEPA